MAGDNVKRGIINPNNTNSLVLFLFGSIIAGFAAGLGWGLATKILEKSGPPVEAYAAKLQRRRAFQSKYAKPFWYR